MIADLTDQGAEYIETLSVIFMPTNSDGEASGPSKKEPKKKCNINKGPLTMVVLDSSDESDHESKTDAPPKLKLR